MRHAGRWHSGALAGVCGIVACALARHLTAALSTAQPSLLLGVEAAFVLALLLSGQIGRSVAWFILGCACALGLPHESPAPQGRVITHSSERFSHEDLFDALAQLDENPGSMLGRRISVTGSWSRARLGAPPAVSRRLMACCAADAVDLGFDVFPAQLVPAPDGAFVRVTGVVRSAIVDGEVRYRLIGASVVRASAGSSGAK